MHLTTEPKIREAETDRKREIDNSTIIAGDLNIPLSTSRYKINKEIYKPIKSNRYLQSTPSTKRRI